jgi:hypothetical protein
MSTHVESKDSNPDGQIAPQAILPAELRSVVFLLLVSLFRKEKQRIWINVT